MSAPSKSGGFARALIFAAFVASGYAIAQTRNPAAPASPAGAPARTWTPTPQEAEAGRGLLLERNDYMKAWLDRWRAAVTDPARARLRLGPEVALDFDAAHGVLFDASPPPASPAAVASDSVSTPTSSTRKE